MSEDNDGHSHGDPFIGKLLVPLHLHSDFSNLDGLATVPGYFERGQQLGLPALGISDHGNMLALPQAYFEAKKRGMYLVGGEEFYMVDSYERASQGKRADKTEASTGKSRYHVTVFGRGREGYRVLSELSTAAFKQFYGKPLLDRALLESLEPSDRKHLTVFSGCAGSMVSQKILNGRYAAAEDELRWWQKLFPHYYAEFMSHGATVDDPINFALWDLSNKLGIPPVITQDAHYLTQDDCSAHDLLLAVQTASDIDDPKRFQFDGGGYYLKDFTDMAKAFRPYPRDLFLRGAKNTLKIARDSYMKMPEWDRKTWNIPRWKSDNPKSAIQQLREMCYSCLRSKGLDENPNYEDRLEYEIDILDEMGLIDFMLITADMIAEARRRKIRVGYGRGSVTGSLVAWLMGITGKNLDPIKYKLSFLRFVNPARPKMGDIDTDYMASRRDEIMEYPPQKYGKDNVLRIAAYGTIQAKKAMRSVGKAYGMSFKDISDASDLMESDPAKAKEKLDSFSPEIYKRTDSIIGAKAGYSAHAAGLIVADPSLKISSMLPEMFIQDPNGKRGEGHWVAQADMSIVDELHLLKLDVLGLVTLDVMEDAVEMVKETRGIEFDPDDWVPDEEEGDEHVYKMLSLGNTEGVFQLEGYTSTPGCKELKPKSFEDIATILALYRPGPRVAKLDEEYLRVRRGGDPRTVHPVYDAILAKTNNVLVYQEDAMEVAEKFTNGDMGLVGDVKTAIGKKRPEFMESLKPTFIAESIKNGIPETVVEQVWREIEVASGYSFSRNHAVGYAFTSYQTARLRYLYPQEFFCALLANIKSGDKRKKEKRTSYLMAAYRQGVNILAPCVNKSGLRARPEGNDIRLGLCDIEGIGLKAAQKIIDRKPSDGYTSSSQVLIKLDSRPIHTRLANAGALEELGVETTNADKEALLDWSFNDAMKEFRGRLGDDITTAPPATKRDARVAGEVMKVEKKKTKSGDSYFLDLKLKWDAGTLWNVKLWKSTEDAWEDIKRGCILQVAGEYDPKWNSLSTGRISGVNVIKGVE